MTEAEAKTKMCCGPQLIGMMIGATALNPQFELMDDAGRCITTQCMAWQPTDNEGAPSAPGEPNQPPKPAGYCGLTRGRQ